MDITGRFYPRLTTETCAMPENPWNLRWNKLLEIAQGTNDHHPVLASEYAHAMGNAVGNLQEYWNEIYSNPQMLGGFMWEWCDQGLHQKKLRMEKSSPRLVVTLGTCLPGQSWNLPASTEYRL